MRSPLPLGPVAFQWLTLARRRLLPAVHGVAMSREALAGGAGMGGELGLRRGRRSEGFVIQGVEILAHRPGCICGADLVRRPILGVAGVLLLDVGCDQAGIYGEALATNSPSAMQRATAVSNTWRGRSLSRKRPCLFFEKVERSGMRSVRSRRQNHRQARFGCTASHSRRSDRMPKQYPSRSTRIISSGSTGGRPGWL